MRNNFDFRYKKLGIKSGKLTFFDGKINIYGIDTEIRSLSIRKISPKGIFLEINSPKFYLEDMDFLKKIKTTDSKAKLFVKIKNGILFYKEKNIGSFNITIDKKGMIGNFHNYILKCLFTYSMDNFSIRFSKIPFLKEFSLDYDLNNKKGGFNSALFSGEITKQKNNYLINGKNISVYIQKGNIDIKKLVYKDFQFKGNINREKGILLGTITRESMKKINLQISKKNANIIASDGTKLLTILPNGNINGSLFLNDIIGSSLDGNLTINGNIKKTAKIGFQNISLNGQYIDSLSGLIDFEKKTLLLKNTGQKITIFVKNNFSLFECSIFDYDFSFIADQIRSITKIPISTGKFENLVWYIKSVNNMYGHGKIVNISNKYIKKGALFFKREEYRDFYTFKFNFNDYALSGKYEKGEIFGDGGGTISFNDLLIFKGCSSFSYKKDFTFIDIKSGNLILAEKELPISGRMEFEKNKLYFKKFKLLNGNINGSIDLKNNSSISTIVDLSEIDARLPAKNAVEFGRRNKNFYLIIDGSNFYSNLIFRKSDVMINKVRFEYEKFKLYFSGDYTKNILNGFMEVNYNEISTTGNVAFNGKRASGLYLIDSLKYRKNELKNGYVEFKLGGKIYFEGNFSDRLSFDGLYTEEDLSLCLRLNNVALRDIFIDMIYISGDLKLNIKDGNFEILGDVNGTGDSIKTKLWNSGPFNYSTIFDYKDKKLNLDFLFMKGNNLWIIAKGNISSQRNYCLSFNKLILKNGERILNTSGNITRINDYYLLELNSSKFNYGIDLSFSRLKWNTITGNVFKLDNLVVDLGVEKISMKDINGKIASSKITGKFSDVNLFGKIIENGRIRIDISEKNRIIFGLFEQLKKRETEFLNGDIRYRDQKFYIDDLHYFGDGGKLSLRGTISEHYALTLYLRSFLLDKKFADFHIKNRFSGEISLGGLLSKPEVFMTINSKDGKINKLKYKKFTLSCYLDRNLLRINHFIFETRLSRFQVSNDTKIYLKNIYAHKDYHLGLSGYLYIEDLKKIFPNIISSGKGIINIDAAYQPAGKVPLTGKVIIDGKMRLRQTFERIEAKDLLLHFRKDGIFEKKGTFYVDGYPVTIKNDEQKNNLNFIFNRQFRFNLPSLGLSILCKGTVGIKFDENIEIFSNDLSIAEGSFHYNPFESIKKSKKELPIKLNLAIIFKSVRFYNFFYDGEIYGNIELTGNLNAPTLRGNINGSAGTIKFYGRTFNIETGKLTIDRHSFLNLVASNDFFIDRKYFVTINLSGQLKKPNLVISSIPEKDIKTLKSALFSKGSVVTGLDLLISKLETPDDFSGSILFNVQKYVQFTNLKVDIKSPILKNSPTDNVTFSLMSHIKKFSIGTRFSFIREDDDSIRFSPEFNLSFRYNRLLQFNFFIGGEKRSMLFAPAITF